MNLPDVDWLGLLDSVIAVGAAYVLALPVGWERRHAEHGYAGLRTFPLVAVGACSYLLIGRGLFESNEGHHYLIQGLMTGIGFIGGGAIIKHEGDVHGVATAASIWNTGAIGAAVAYDRYAIAILLCLANLLILGFVRRPDKGTGQDTQSKE